ncbi:MAG TPA: hypothetical protein VE219_00360 [Candidatus Sulfotelmatobacter sp.]|nr:hypothetical protein [Candidatus Sulfotelmatobacter sp.]
MIDGIRKLIEFLGDALLEAGASLAATEPAVAAALMEARGK